MFRMGLMSVLLEEEGEAYLPDVTKYEILLFDYFKISDDKITRLLIYFFNVS